MESDTVIFDEEETIENRYNAIVELYKRDPNYFLECINSLTTSFSQQNTHIMEELLTRICSSLEIDSIILIQIANCIYLEKPDIAYNLFYTIVSTRKVSQISILIDVFKILFETNVEDESERRDETNTETETKVEERVDMKRQSELLSLFISQILQSTTVDEVYKMKIVNNIQKCDKILKVYIEGIYSYILCNFSDRYKIIASQYLLQTRLSDDYIINILYSISSNIDNNYNTRADACDVILHYGTDEQKKNTMIILRELSGNVKGTIYENKQNVHIVELDKSVKEIIDKLFSMDIEVKRDGEERHNPSGYDTNDEDNDYEATAETETKVETEATAENETTVENEATVETETVECKKTTTIDNIESILLLTFPQQSEEIKTSLFRITIDNTLYNTHNLSSILLRIWNYIHCHESKHTLLQRLCEELVDMNDTCSSGHVSRLVNVLHSFGFELSIGYEEQIKANLFARLNKIIQSIPSSILHKYITIGGIKVEVVMTQQELEDYQENIINEISQSDVEMIDKPNLQKFLKDNLNNLRDEIYVEFKEYISESKLDEYIRKATEIYEGN